MARPPKSQLSKNLLDMKFMKKSKEKVEKEETEAESKIMYEGKIADEMNKSINRFIIEPSIARCLQLNFGRMSFKGMNPEIEKIMSSKEAKFDEKDRKMSGISDKEMAERYSTLVGTMGKKFSSKRQHTNENLKDNKKLKKNFIKPSY
ncbi:MPHOSPH6 (predicted) [Pycnogonum litorale]